MPGTYITMSFENAKLWKHERGVGYRSDTWDGARQELSVVCDEEIDTRGGGCEMQGVQWLEAKRRIRMR